MPLPSDPFLAALVWALVAIVVIVDGALVVALAVVAFHRARLAYRRAQIRKMLRAYDRAPMEPIPPLTTAQQLKRIIRGHTSASR